MAATGWTLAKRPHYTPPDRLGEAALVQLAQPVNRFPDYVRELVRSLKHTVPWMRSIDSPTTCGSWSAA